jgi:hypothetical protein
LVRKGLAGVGLVGWGGVEIAVKMVISGNGFDAVDAEHVVELLDIVDV